MYSENWVSTGAVSEDDGTNHGAKRKRVGGTHGQASATSVVACLASSCNAQRFFSEPSNVNAVLREWHGLTESQKDAIALMAVRAPAHVTAALVAAGGGNVVARGVSRRDSGVSEAWFSALCDALTLCLRGPLCGPETHENTMGFVRDLERVPHAECVDICQLAELCLDDADEDRDGIVSQATGVLRRWNRGGVESLCRMTLAICRGVQCSSSVRSGIAAELIGVMTEKLCAFERGGYGMSGAVYAVGCAPCVADFMGSVTGNREVQVAGVAFFLRVLNGHAETLADLAKDGTLDRMAILSLKASRAFPTVKRICFPAMDVMHSIRSSGMLSAEAGTAVGEFLDLPPEDRAYYRPIGGEITTVDASVIFREGRDIAARVAAGVRNVALGDLPRLKRKAEILSVLDSMDALHENYVGFSVGTATVRYLDTLIEGSSDLDSDEKDAMRSVRAECMASGVSAVV